MEDGARPERLDFLEFIGREQTNLLASLLNIRSEMNAFSAVDGLYQSAIRKVKISSDDDYVPCQLLLFIHYHFFNSAATYLRCHLSESLNSMRCGIDAALTAYRVIDDRESQYLYLDRDKSFQFPKEFFRKSWKKDSSSFPLAKILIEYRDACSQHASHADINTFIHRLDFPKRKGDLFQLEYFQHSRDIKEFAWWFLMLVKIFLYSLLVFEPYLVGEKQAVDQRWVDANYDLGTRIEKHMASLRGASRDEAEA